MVENKCPCCHSFVYLYSKKKGSSFYCNKCDHEWFNSSIYSISQDSYEKSNKYEAYYLDKAPFLWYHQKSLDFLKSYIGDGRVLDFGCFDGFFTAKLVDTGIDAYGCDWNRKAIEFGRKAYNLGPRLSYAPEGEYSAIVALEVIEHFSDPNSFLDTVLPHLAPEGALVLSCPNKNSIYRPKTDAPPHHFSRFSQKSLSALLARRGMKVEIHEREMSSFQLIRNFIGDSLRRDAPLLNDGAEQKLANERILQLKRLANAIAGRTSFILRPVDAVAHALGFSYFAQFVVARRDLGIGIDRSGAK